MAFDVMHKLILKIMYNYNTNVKPTVIVQN